MPFDLSDDAVLVAIVVAFGFTSLNLTLAAIFEVDVAFVTVAFPVVILIVVLAMVFLGDVLDHLRGAESPDVDGGDA